jgi:hypothetical protein
MAARNSNRLADPLISFLEDAISGSTNVFRRDPRELLLSHRERDRQLAIRALLRAHAEVDEVVPVE